MTKNKIIQKGKQQQKQQTEQENSGKQKIYQDENQINGNTMSSNRNQNRNNNRQNNSNINEYNFKEEEEAKENRYLKEISQDENIQNENMYIDDPTIFFNGEVIDYQNSEGNWVDAVVLMKSKGRLRVQTISGGLREEEWIDKCSQNIVKQWKPSYSSNTFIVNQRLAILDREINENSKLIQKDNYYEGRVTQSDTKLKEIHVTYTPKYSSDFDEWISFDSQRIKPISFLINYKNQNKNYGQWSKNNNAKDKKQLKKMARDYECSQVKEYKENILKKGLVLREMDPDGNCLFRSVADQLYGDQSLHSYIRKYVIEYLVIEKQYFINFIAEMEENSKSSKKKKNNQPLQQQQKIEEIIPADNTPQSEIDVAFDNYVKEMSEDGTWGDDVEIQIISEIYKRSVEIYYAFEETPMRTFHENQDKFNNGLPIRLSYHGKCHYNSIKSISHDRLIPQKIGVVEEEALQFARNKQEAIKQIQDKQGDGISQDLQNLCRQRFELIQNYSNTEELYQRLIQEQYESQAFAENNNLNQNNTNNNNQFQGSIYQAERFNLMNGPCNQELALQLALEESRYMMEQQQLSTGDQEEKNKQMDNPKQDQMNDNIQQTQNLQNEGQQNYTQEELEKIVVLNSVINAGFLKEQAELAMQIVGPNEDLIVNYILENLM